MCSPAGQAVRSTLNFDLGLLVQLPLGVDQAIVRRVDAGEGEVISSSRISIER